jgi:hypothetical protein
MDTFAAFGTKASGVQAAKSLLFACFRSGERPADQDLTAPQATWEAVRRWRTAEKKSARSASYLAPPRLIPSRTWRHVRWSYKQTISTCRVRAASIQCQTPRSGQSDSSRREPIREAAIKLVQEPLLTPDPVQFALPLFLRARQQQAIVADNLLPRISRSENRRG